ncbi:thiocillin family RiPP [Staphylococcus sp. GSSP0090]|nr:thiocillin family RiPP [Staphylococcus sp. GSSP0090]
MKETNIEMEEIENTLNSLFIEEEEASVEVAASLATLSTLGTASGCASSAGTVSCYG